MKKAISNITLICSAINCNTKKCNKIFKNFECVQYDDGRFLDVKFEDAVLTCFLENGKCVYACLFPDNEDITTYEAHCKANYKGLIENYWHNDDTMIVLRKSLKIEESNYIQFSKWEQYKC